MSQPPSTLPHHAGAHLSEGRHAAVLAQILGCPVTTARSWTNGKRRLPPGHARVLAEALRTHAAQSRGLADELERYAVQREQEKRYQRRRGFFEMKCCDGPGSAPRNAIWRGGRSKSFS